jgi:hypothetical protein
MFKFLFENIFLVFCNQVFQQSVEIPMATNFVPSLVDLFFIFSYEPEFIHKPLHEKNKPLSMAFNTTFRYID